VLVRVHAASVNRLDWHLLRGSPYISRLQAGLRKPKDRVLGADVAGKVEAVGKYVTKFQPGDEVFGSLFGHGFGAFAEYVSVSGCLLELKPANLSFDQAAAVPVAALTALQGPARSRTDRARARGSDHRRLGRRGDVRRADRQVLRRRGDRRVQHEER
jgi:NADPH:quinone reductase-like Zn-dependent oxidoreductase